MLRRSVGTFSSVKMIRSCLFGLTFFEITTTPFMSFSTELKRSSTASDGFCTPPNFVWFFKHQKLWWKRAKVPMGSKFDNLYSPVLENIFLKSIIILIIIDFILISFFLHSEDGQESEFKRNASPSKSFRHRWDSLSESLRFGSSKYCTFSLLSKSVKCAAYQGPKLVQNHVIWISSYCAQKSNESF